MFVGLYFYSKKDSVDVSKVDGTQINQGMPESGGLKDSVSGNINAKVTLIEYGDYQCPACHNIHSTVKSLTENNKDSMRFVFRNFPISDKHPNARAAAAAAEVAGIQDKFWEMHNALYERYDEWVNASGDDRTNVFKSIAKDIGLNADEFLKIMEERSSDINKKINFDKQLGLKYQVTGTPSFFLNGRKLSDDDLKTVDAFKKIVADEITKNK
jgi:protein-disulfide isomerase